VSSILWVAFAASLKTDVQGYNHLRFGVSGAELGELVLCLLTVGIAGDWEPRSCLQVGIVGCIDFPAEIASAVVFAVVVMALAADRLADTALEICLVNSAGRAAAVSSGSWLRYGLTGCNNNKRGCLLLPPSMRAPLPALYLPQLRG
jgi:hypothetical protein